MADVEFLGYFLITNHHRPGQLTPRAFFERTKPTMCTASDRLARIAAGEGARMPVDYVDGNKPPTVEGEHWHFETSGRTVIYHPSAYSRKGWSNMHYQCSTLRVEVGRKWLERNGKALAICEDSRCWGHVEQKRISKLLKGLNRC